MSMRSNKTINLIGAFATAAITTFGPSLASAQAQQHAAANSSNPQPSSVSISPFPRSDCEVEPKNGVRFDEGYRNGRATDTLLRRNGNSLFLTIVGHTDSKPDADFEFRNFLNKARTQVFYHGIELNDAAIIQKDIRLMWEHINLCKGRGELGIDYLLSPNPS